MEKINRTVVRNERYTKSGIAIRERHNERKNECYSNPDVLLEYSGNNVVFKRCEAETYACQFDRMVEGGIISTRGLKAEAYVFDELVFDVNTEYFEQHGGYEYAKDFYAEAYKLAMEIVGGEQYVVSAVMHADERNREASERLGKDVFHYHLHVVYIPVVEKQIKWSKRCKDPALIGTVKETIVQVSHSKKWPMMPKVDADGKVVLKKNGSPQLISSYSLLQTKFYEHMKSAGFEDFERGIEGSTAEHLNVLDYKIQQDTKAVQGLEQQLLNLNAQVKETTGKRDSLQRQAAQVESDIEEISAIRSQVEEIESRTKTKGLLQKKIELSLEDFQTLKMMALDAAKLQSENRGMWFQMDQIKKAKQELQWECKRLREQLFEVKEQAGDYLRILHWAPELTLKMMEELNKALERQMKDKENESPKKYHGKKRENEQIR